MALSSKGNATKRLMTTVPVFARAAAGHHLLKMQVICTSHIRIVALFECHAPYAVLCMTDLEQL